MHGYLVDMDLLGRTVLDSSSGHGNSLYVVVRHHLEVGLQGACGEMGFNLTRINNLDYSLTSVVQGELAAILERTRASEGSAPCRTGRRLSEHLADASSVRPGEASIPREHNRERL
jgi:hypothetical protein